MDRKFLVGSRSNGVQLIGDLGGDSPSLGQAATSDPVVSVDEGVESEKRPGFLFIAFSAHPKGGAIMSRLANRISRLLFWLVIFGLVVAGEPSVQARQSSTNSFGFNLQLPEDPRNSI